jgi:hypothetical protein
VIKTSDNGRPPPVEAQSRPKRWEGHPRDKGAASLTAAPGVQAAPDAARFRGRKARCMRSS